MKCGIVSNYVNKNTIEQSHGIYSSNLQIFF